MATSETQQTIGTQLNSLGDIVAKYIASLQKSDNTIKSDITTKHNGIVNGTTALSKVTLKSTGSDTANHTISVTNGTPKYDAGTNNPRDIVLKPLIVNTTNPNLNVAENTVYKYTSKLSSLELTITNSTLESRIYFQCATDDFSFNVSGGDNLLLNIEPDDIEWDANSWYCISILDGIVSVAPAYKIR